MSAGAGYAEARLELHASKLKASWLLGPALLYLALADVLWRRWVASHGAAYELVFPTIFLIGGLFILAEALHVLTRSKPIIRLSPEGLVDESSLSAVGLVPWADIAALAPRRMIFQAYLGILLKDTDRFAARLGPWRRFALRMRVGRGFPPILIAQTVLPISAVELAHQIDGRFGIPVLSK